MILALADRVESLEATLAEIEWVEDDESDPEDDPEPTW